MLEILLGQIPEAIYFSLFIIFTRRLKTNNIWFISLMILEYIILWNFIPYSIWTYVLYFILTYCIMKILYTDTNITNIFTLGIASIIILFVSIFTYFIVNIFTNNIIIGNVVQKILLFIVLFLCKPYLYKLETLYNKLWDRSKHKYKMKSTTFRALNLVVFNIMFYVINICILFYTDWR